MGYCRLGVHPPHLKKNCKECENHIPDPEEKIVLRLGTTAVCTTEPDCTPYCHKWATCPIRKS